MMNSKLFTYWSDIALSYTSLKVSKKLSYKDFSKRDSKDIALAILKVGYGFNSNFYLRSTGVFSWGRTSPSAGGLYPLKVFVFLKRKNDLFDIFAYCIETSSLIFYDTVSSFNETENAQLYKFDILLLFAADPALSMAKYGLRGYYYSIVDTAHAFVNTMTYARALTADTTMITKFDKHKLSDDLGLTHLQIEPLAFVVLNSDNELLEAEVVKNVNRGYKRDGQSIDRQYNEQLADILAERPDEKAYCVTNDASGFPIGGLVNAPVDDANDLNCSNFPSLTHLRSIKYAIVNRSSSKMFSASVLSSKTILNLLSTQGFPIQLDYPVTILNAIEMRMIIKNSDIPEGIYTFDTDTETLRIVGPINHSVNLVEAFMNQEWISSCNAVIILYSNHFTNDICKSIFMEQLLNAVIVGNFLYLACSLNRIGISCIGAFDQAKLKKITDIDYPDLEILYVAVIGNDGEIRLQIDKEDKAYHH